MFPRGLSSSIKNGAFPFRPTSSSRWRTAMRLAITAASLALSGCAAGAKVDLAAADTIDLAVANLQRSLDESRVDLDASDETRESEVTQAFIARVQSATTPQETDRHAAEFAAALAKIRADRDVSRLRHSLSLETLDALRETSAALRHVALQSLAIDKEASRQIESLLSRKPPTSTKEKP